MMRQSQTAVLERGVRLPDQPNSQPFCTEPFEVAWAGEARWFVQFLEAAPETEFMITIQVSPDGLAWTDHETAAVTTAANGLITVPVSRFGHWLRLRLERTVGDDSPLTRIYLSLKE